MQDSQENLDDEFDAAAQQPDATLLQELWQFIRENKAWWMIPILVVLGLVGVLIMLGSTGAAPFIYTLF